MPLAGLFNCNIVAVFKNFSEVCIAHLLYISRRAYKLGHINSFIQTQSGP